MSLVSLIERSKGWKRLCKSGCRGRKGGNTGSRTWWKSKMTDSRSFRSALQTGLDKKFLLILTDLCISS